MTPAAVHHGQAEQPHADRALVLQAAFPARSKRRDDPQSRRVAEGLHTRRLRRQLVDVGQAGANGLSLRDIQAQQIAAVVHPSNHAHCNVSETDCSHLPDVTFGFAAACMTAALVRLAAPRRDVVDFA